MLNEEITLWLHFIFFWGVLVCASDCWNVLLNLVRAEEISPSVWLNLETNLLGQWKIFRIEVIQYGISRKNLNPWHGSYLTSSQRNKVSPLKAKHINQWNILHYFTSFGQKTDNETLLLSLKSYQFLLILCSSVSSDPSEWYAHFYGLVTQAADDWMRRSNWQNAVRFRGTRMKRNRANRNLNVGNREGSILFFFSSPVMDVGPALRHGSLQYLPVWI